MILTFKLFNYELNKVNNNNKFLIKMKTVIINKYSIVV